MFNFTDCGNEESFKEKTPLYLIIRIVRFSWSRQWKVMDRMQQTLLLFPALSAWSLKQHDFIGGKVSIFKHHFIKIKRYEA